VEKAAVLAAKVNRLAGSYANPTPATQVMQLIKHIPKAMVEILKERVNKHEASHARSKAVQDNKPR